MSPFTPVLIGGVLIVFALVVYLAIRTAQFNAAMKRETEDLTRHGFVSTYSVNGSGMSVHFDSQNGWIAFVSEDGWKTYGFDEIIKWEHTWTPVPGYENTFLHSVQFTVRDIENPLYTITLESGECDMLVARTTAFVDSANPASR